jgi:hypothetical protein
MSKKASSRRSSGSKKKSGKRSSSRSAATKAAEKRLEAAKLLLWSKGTPAPRPARYRRLAPWEVLPLGQHQELDPWHVFYWALADRNSYFAEQLGKATRYPPDEVSYMWLWHNVNFTANCLWKIFGTPDHPAPLRTPTQAKLLIRQLRNSYWRRLPRYRGRPKTLPPDPDTFHGIEDLRERFQAVRTDVWRPYKAKVDPKAWENGVAVRRLLDEDRYNDQVDVFARGSLELADVPLDLLRDRATRTFVIDRIKEQPTRAALTVALEIAKGEYGYVGEYRTFYDAWRRSRGKSGAAAHRRRV